MTFNVGKQIGAGGFGEVFEVERAKDGRKFALKQLAAHADPDARKRFAREVRLQKQLRHPHVVPIVVSNLTDDPPWFVMPLADLSLRDHLKTATGETEIWIWEEVAEGIAFAHENGIIHRDIKPENVLFLQKPGGTRLAAVSDFGLGRLLVRDTTTLTLTGIGMGTFAYMAPEQIRDSKTVDEKSDIYALGKLLYEILTGHLPFPHLDFALVPHKFAFPLRKATANDPTARYSSVTQFLDQIRALANPVDALALAPAAAVKAELQKVAAMTKLTAMATEELVRLFHENVQETAVLTEILPSTPEPVLRALMGFHPESMLTILHAYDAEVSGGLPFSYCDVVADFYRTLFDENGPMEINMMVLKRLPQVAAGHSRWHVGNVFGALLASITTMPVILAACDALTEIDPGQLNWCVRYIELGKIPKKIRSILEERIALAET